MGAVTIFDATESSDPESEVLQYQWDLISVPSGSSATILSPTTAEPSLTPDIAGTYNVRLTLTDSVGTETVHPVRFIAQSPKALDELLIYYGWPSLINSASGNLSAAASEIGAYDTVVFGAGLEDASHGDHDNLMTILRDDALQDVVTFGYVDLGVTTNNYTMLEVQTKVKNWFEMGIDGIFFDDFGYDFETDRPRQNAAVEYVHSLGLRVFANGFDPDHVFSSAQGVSYGGKSYNNAGASTSLSKYDLYLYESFQISEGDYVKNGLGAYDSTLWFGKMDKLRYYVPYKNIYGITTDDAMSVYDSGKFGYAFASALIYDIGGFGRGEYLFASSGTSANAVPYRTRPTVSFTDYTDPIVSLTQYDPPFWQYERDTDGGTITVNGSPTHSFSLP